MLCEQKFTCKLVECRMHILGYVEGTSYLAVCISGCDAGLGGPWQYTRIASPHLDCPDGGTERG